MLNNTTVPWKTQSTYTPDPRWDWLPQPFSKSHSLGVNSHATSHSDFTGNTHEPTLSENLPNTPISFIFHNTQKPSMKRKQKQQMWHRKSDKGINQVWLSICIVISLCGSRLGHRSTPDPIQIKSRSLSMFDGDQAPIKSTNPGPSWNSSHTSPTAVSFHRSNVTRTQHKKRTKSFSDFSFSLETKKIKSQ